MEVGIDKIIWTWRPEAKFTPETKEKLRKWGKFMVRLIDEITPPEAMEEWGQWQPQERKGLHNYGGNIDTSQWQKEQPSISSKRWPCYHLWFAPAVAWNGNILMCCNDPRHQEVLGKFPDQSIAEVWKGKQISEIRRSHLQSEYRGICTNCDVWKTYPDSFFGFQKGVKRDAPFIEPAAVPSGVF